MTHLTANLGETHESLDTARQTEAEDADSVNRPAAGSHTESLDANHQTEAETQTV